MSTTSWHRADDDASLNPKLGKLTDSEYRALTLGVWAYCSRRRNAGLFDVGELPAMVYVTLRGPRSVTRAQVARFEALGLVDRVSVDAQKSVVDARLRPDCFVVHDWLIHNGETIAERVGAWLQKFPESSANETHRAVGGKRESVLSEHARQLAARGTHAVPGYQEGTTPSRYPSGTPMRASADLDLHLETTPSPSPESLVDQDEDEEISFEDYRAAEIANGRPASDLEPLGSVLARMVDEGEPA